MLFLAFAHGTARRRYVPTVGRISGVVRLLFATFAGSPCGTGAANIAKWIIPGLAGSAHTPRPGIFDGLPIVLRAVSTWTANCLAGAPAGELRYTIANRL